ncbi:GGDEF domain-containing protein [Nitrospira moscoviensis]|nr:GGDEF domain-containing protein [Nitrospira moscoviensis]
MAASDAPRYDPRALLNSQPVIITVIDPVTHKAVFQNSSSLSKFGDISNQSCHEKIAGCAAPCEFCKMPDAVAQQHPTASEVPLPNDEYLLVQWAPVATEEGAVHVVETITDITAYKRQQSQTEQLVKRLSDTNRELLHTNEQLRDQSSRDSLTGLFNHSYFQQALTQMCARSARSARPLSLLFIDLDNFKNINDTYGHAAGDQVLKEMGWLLDSHQAARRLARAGDIAARYGGEEFALILPDTSMEGALSAAERVRHRVTTLLLLPELAPLAKRDLSLTCSIGVASFPIHATNASGLVAAADAAVYVAKRSGKNCVRMATPVTPKPLVRS